MIETAEQVPRHPAPWNRDVLAAVEAHVVAEGARRDGATMRVLDPFAGIGRIHELRDMLWPIPVETVGVEIEPEWAAASPHTITGDALALPPEWTESFHLVATSPTFANRMADHHDAQERCRDCRETGYAGVVEGDVLHHVGEPCPKCGGTGRREYQRNTYRHSLGRSLSPASTAGLGWLGREGDAYRELHLRAWAEAHRVLMPGGMILVNIKNHIRTVGGERGEMPVVEWHVGALAAAGFRLRDVQSFTASGLRHGANRDLRTESEFLLILRRPE